MNFNINGKAYPLSHEADTNISLALTLYFIKPEQSTFAVALNGHFVGKADYDTTLIKSGDSLDVLQPIQGG